ncbi:MAG: ATP/GTP-binding protein [Thiotrichales bacterium]
MANYKIVFTGPVGAGKTTAIGAISQIAPINTEAIARDATRLRKPSTTVAMDYGLLTLGKEERVHLYGTPGQERFDFMWEILAEGGLGIVLLLDNSRVTALGDLAHYVEAFRASIDRSRLVVGITRMDECRKPGLATYAARLAQMGLRAPVLEVDARRKPDVSRLLEALLYSIDPGLDLASPA